MKEKKRCILNLVIILLIVLLCMGVLLIIKSVALDYKSNEKKILLSYETKKAEYDLVYSLLDNVLVEGKCIDTKKIPNDKIKYRIYDYNDNIVFSFSLKEEYSSNKELYAKITLSNDYNNVISEEYSSKLESFKEYKDEYVKIARYVISYSSVIIIMLLFAILFLIGSIVVIALFGV